MIEIGKYNDLEILRETSVGLFLGDESGEDVLLPNKYCPAEYEIGQTIRVFVYLDNEARKIATNLIPGILLNEYALLKVKAVEDVGAFLDWGLEKDLLVPFREQRQKMEPGRWYVVYMDIDPKSGRLFASNKIESRLDNETLEIKVGDQVDVLILQKTDLGYSVIINNKHKGLIYNNEIFRTLNIGEKLPGFVKAIREDNKVDISLQPIGYKESLDPHYDLILRVLIENGGKLSMNDKSAPELIYSTFGISKKAFKRAVGALYKEKIIEISGDGIKLLEQDVSQINS